MAKSEVDLIEFKTDPNVPSLPPHIKLEQAKKFASTLLQGDPDEAGVIVQTAKQIFGAVMPGGFQKVSNAPAVRDACQLFLRSETSGEALNVARLDESIVYLGISEILAKCR